MSSQPANQPTREQIGALSPDLNPANIDGSFGLYAAAQQEAGYLAPAVNRDISYGPDPRHLLDVHSAAGGGAAPAGGGGSPAGGGGSPGGAGGAPAGAGGAPVLVFVHGGGFTGGDRQLDGTPFYDNVGGWAVRHGLVAVLMTYRLAPAHQWPAGAQDVASAVAWVRSGIASYGGDPERIVLAGHSAGGTHVASYIAGHAGTPPAVAGAAMLSGIYEVTAAGRAMQAPYFGDDPVRYPARSPRRALAGAAIPMLFAVAEYDPAPFHAGVADVARDLVQCDGVLPPLVYVQGHNHITEIASLGIDDEPLGAPLLRFITTVTGGH